MKKIIFLVLTLISVTSFSINYDDCLGYWKDERDNEILIEKINDNQYTLTTFRHYANEEKEETKYSLKPTPYGLAKVQSKIMVDDSTYIYNALSKMFDLEQPKDDSYTYIYNTEVVTEETLQKSRNADDLQLGKKTLQIVISNEYGSEQYNKSRLSKNKIKEVQKGILNRIVYSDPAAFGYIIEY